MSLVKKLEQDLRAFIQKIEQEFQGHAHAGDGADDAVLHAKITDHVAALKTTLATAGYDEATAQPTASSAAPEDQGTSSPAAGAETDPSAPIT